MFSRTTGSRVSGTHQDRWAAGTLPDPIFLAHVSLLSQGRVSRTRDAATFFLSVPGRGTTAGEGTDSSPPMLGRFQASELASIQGSPQAGLSRREHIEKFRHHLQSISPPLCVHEENFPFFFLFPLAAAATKEHP